MRKCEICGKTIIIDPEAKPGYISITGWHDDCFQANLDVCNECFVNTSNEILKKLEKMEYS